MRPTLRPIDTLFLDPSRVVQELGVHQNSSGLSSFSPLKHATNWVIHHFGRTKTQVNMAHMTKVLMPVNTHQCTPCINYASISSFTTCLAVAKCGEMKCSFDITQAWERSYFRIFWVVFEISQSCIGLFLPSKRFFGPSD